MSDWQTTSDTCYWDTQARENFMIGGWRREGQTFKTTTCQLYREVLGVNKSPAVWMKTPKELVLCGSVISHCCGSRDGPLWRISCSLIRQRRGGASSRAAQFPVYRSTVLELRPRLCLKFPPPRVWQTDADTWDGGLEEGGRWVNVTPDWKYTQTIKSMYFNSTIVHFSVQKQHLMYPKWSKVFKIW